MLSTMNLTSITMPQGIKITPGGYVSSAGDVNGDGYDDFFVNVYSETYLIWGKAAGWQDINLLDLTISQGIEISCSDGIGSAIGVEDVNGDGYSDILISVPNKGEFHKGISYLIWGKATGWQNIDLNNFDYLGGVTITGASYGDYSGSFISKLKDVNGGGYADFLIGTDDSGSGSNSGTAYLIFGQSAWENIDLDSLKLSQGIKIYFPTSYIIGATSVGDVNDDKYNDFLVNTFYTGSNTGKSYLIWGKSGTWTDVNLSNFSKSQGIIIEDSNHHDTLNWPINSAGDVNGDQYDDILISTYDTYLIWGKATGGWHDIDLANFNTSHGIAIQTPSYFAYSGSPIGGVGDVNNNGYDDILIGASITGRSGEGVIYLILGNAALYHINLEIFNSSQGIKIQNTYTGASISNVRDVNKDGYDDFLVGAAYGITTQASYLIFGGKIETPTPTINPDHPTTSTTIMPTAPTMPTSPTTSTTATPTAPTMPTLPTTPYPTVEHPTIAPTNDTYAGSESHSESWASSTTGIAAIATLGAVFAVALVGLGTWYYCHKYKTYDDKTLELLEHAM